MTPNVFFATGSIDHSIRIWETHTGNCLYALKHTGSHVNSLAFDPNRCYLLSGGFECVRLFDAQRPDEECILQVNSLKKNTNAVGFNIDGRWFFCGNEDGTVNVIDGRSNSQSCLSRFQASASVNCIESHPNQHELIIGDDLGELTVWDIRNDKNVVVKRPQPSEFVGDLSNSIQSISVNTDATELAVMTAGGICYRSILPRNTASELREFSPYNVLTCRTGSGGGGGARTNPALNKEAPALRTYLPQETPHYGLHIQFSPDSTQLCACTSESRAEVMRTTDLELQCSLRHPVQHSWVWQAAFSADSSHIVTACSDNMARLWNLEEQALVKEYRGHQRAVTCLAFYDDYSCTPS